MIIHNVTQNTPEWHELRSGIPTASCFSKILTPKTLKPSKSDYHFVLASQIIAGYDCDEWEGNEHTDHGHDCEDNARKAYAIETGVKPDKVGFITNDAGTIGCSPDATVGEYGLLEIKSFKAKNILKIYAEWLLDGVCPAELKLQVQGQLMISEKDWCDVVLYHPRMPIKIMRILPDLEIHKALMGRIQVVMQMRDVVVSQNMGF